MIKTYLSDLQKSKPLSSQEELQLATSARSGNIQARNKLVQANLRYAFHLANKFRTSALPLEDLVSAANLGLMTAAEKFDPSFGVRFITYARTWIQEAIMRELKERYLIHTPSAKEQMHTTLIDLS